MNTYLLVKHIHVSAVVLSGTGFLLRGVLMLRRSPWLQQYWVRRVPHGVDTVLLVSALTLAAMSGQYPFVLGWLTAKVGFLIAHILFGAVALYRGRTMGGRVACLLASIACFANIVAIALSRDPRGLLAWLV